VTHHYYTPPQYLSAVDSITNVTPMHFACRNAAKTQGHNEHWQKASMWSHLSLSVLKAVATEAAVMPYMQS
jgi:hypothetical protein